MVLGINDAFFSHFYIASGHNTIWRKKHDFGLLAQSVALKDKSDEIQKKIDDQKKLVDELKFNLMQ